MFTVDLLIFFEIIRVFLSESKVDFCNLINKLIMIKRWNLKFEVDLFINFIIILIQEKFKRNLLGKKYPSSFLAMEGK